MVTSAPLCGDVGVAPAGPAAWASLLIYNIMDIVYTHYIHIHIIYIYIYIHMHIYIYIYNYNVNIQKMIT